MKYAIAMYQLVVGVMFAFALQLLLQVKKVADMFVAFVVSMLVAVPAMAQVPTGLPAEWQTALDNGYILAGAAGVAVFALIGLGFVLKWLRGMFF